MDNIIKKISNIIVELNELTELVQSKEMLANIEKNNQKEYEAKVHKQWLAMNDEIEQLKNRIKEITNKGETP